MNFESDEFEEFLKERKMTKGILVPDNRGIFPELRKLLSEGKSVFLTGAGGCFTGDTKIPLLSGEEVPIKELVNRDEFWLYSCTPDGEVMPGLGRFARVTKEVNELIEITLDNNEKIKCSTDHKFMMRNGNYKEACKLKETDSLMPGYFNLHASL